MKVDGKAILDKLRKEKGDRSKVSLYLSKKVFTDFKAKCEHEGISASAVMEELMKSFTDSTRGRK